MVERRTRPFTYADDCALDDDTRHEVVDGELVVSPAPALTLRVADVGPPPGSLSS